MQRISSIKESPGLIFLLSIFAASLCLNVALGWKVKQLIALQELSNAKPVGIQVNAVLPTIHVIDENGKTVSISFSGPRSTVLYVWRPSCAWCKLNQPNIKALASAANPRFRFIGLSIEEKGLKQYLAKNGYSFPVYVVKDARVIQKLGLGITPQTAVVNPGGEVDRVWIGAFNRTTDMQIERFFNVKLSTNRVN